LSGQPSCGHVLPLPAGEGFGVSLGFFSCATAAQRAVTLTHRNPDPAPVCPSSPHHTASPRAILSGLENTFQARQPILNSSATTSSQWAKTTQKAQPGTRSAAWVSPTGRAHVEQPIFEFQIWAPSHVTRPCTHQAQYFWPEPVNLVALLGISRAPRFAIWHPKLHVHLRF